METRILIGYGLLACVVLAIFAWVSKLALNHWRARMRRKHLWKRYYK